MDRNRILFVCQDYTHANDGQNVVTRRNLRLLKKCGIEVDEIMIESPSKGLLLKNVLMGESYGYNRTVAKKVNAALEKNYLFVFFDRSIFGPLVKKFAQKGLHTICFYHNVEAHISKRRLQVTKNPFYWLLYRNTCSNEAVASEYAETCISISERDQHELQEVYGLKKVYLMPTSFIPAPQEYFEIKEKSNNPYCLFVGSDFFANLEGMRWFIKEVVPNIPCNLKVVGSICNSLKSLDLPHNVQLEGYVDNLNEYYRNAICVVSPIFSGSGIKTKTIEALKYGKTILGTDEALVGINLDLLDRIGKLCNTKQDFIEAINGTLKCPALINDGSLSVFNEYFSDEVAQTTLMSIIDKMFADAETLDSKTI